MMNTIREAYGSVVSKIGSPTRGDHSLNKKILCVGLCTLDIVQVVKTFPLEDSDQRFVRQFASPIYFIVRNINSDDLKMKVSNFKVMVFQKDEQITNLQIFENNECHESRWCRGGNASNNCTVLSQLGMPCEYLGTLSKENHLNFLLEDFNKYNISMDHCVYYTECEAPLSTVIISLENGTRTILHSNPNLPELKYDAFQKINLKSYCWIHFEGRNVSEVALMMEYVEHWNSKEETLAPIKISLDLEKPKTELLDLLPYADVVFVGKDFAHARKCSNMSETLKSVAKDTKPGATIICAWGDRGAMARAPDGSTVQSPAYPPRKVLDTLGAGDTFCATVIFSLSGGRSLQDSVSLGCRVAGAKVGQKGLSDVANIYERICSSTKT